MWNKNPARQPRTEQHFEALHKRAENVHKVLNEYRRYADYLESLLDQKSSGDFDFRSLRPSIPDGLMGTIPIESRHAEFTLEIEQDESSDSDDPTLSRLAAKGLTVIRLLSWLYYSLILFSSMKEVTYFIMAICLLSAFGKRGRLNLLDSPPYWRILGRCMSSLLTQSPKPITIRILIGLVTCRLPFR